MTEVHEKQQPTKQQRRETKGMSNAREMLGRLEKDEQTQALRNHDQFIKHFTKFVTEQGENKQPRKAEHNHFWKQKLVSFSPINNNISLMKGYYEQRHRGHNSNFRLNGSRLSKTPGYMESLLDSSGMVSLPLGLRKTVQAMREDDLSLAPINVNDLSGTFLDKSGSGPQISSIKEPRYIRDVAGFFGFAKMNELSCKKVSYFHSRQKEILERLGQSRSQDLASQSLEEEIQPSSRKKEKKSKYGRSLGPIVLTEEEVSKENLATLANFTSKSPSNLASPANRQSSKPWPPQNGLPVESALRDPLKRNTHFPAPVSFKVPQKSVGQVHFLNRPLDAKSLSLAAGANPNKW